MAGTQNVRESEGQSRVCQVAGTPNARLSEGQSQVSLHGCRDSNLVRE